MYRSYSVLLCSICIPLLLVTQHPKHRHAPTPKEKVVTTASGLKYVDYQIGTGPYPRQGQTILVNYTGKLNDSTIFDSSVLPKFDHVRPFPFRIGMGQVIKGWDEGIMSMRVGGKRRLVIPPQLGYGSKGFLTRIPPNATIVFDVELVGFSENQ